MNNNQPNPLSSFIDNFANSLTQHEQKIKEFARIEPKEYENLHEIVEIKNLVKEFKTKLLENMETISKGVVFLCHKNNLQKNKKRNIYYLQMKSE